MDVDVLIIGSGAAGLTAALQLATSRKVAVLAKGAISDGATAWAQGGIAAVLAPDDTAEEHIADTLAAGAGLCVDDTVRTLVAEGPREVERAPCAAQPHARKPAGLRRCRFPRNGTPPEASAALGG